VIDRLKIDGQIDRNTETEDIWRDRDVEIEILNMV
jgi:hypothetical protein